MIIEKKLVSNFDANLDKSFLLVISQLENSILLDLNLNLKFLSIPYIFDFEKKICKCGS